MCGITGFIDFNNKLTREHLTNACSTLQHRGPDDTGTIIEDTGSALIGFGHRRLSILDISALGHQPMYSDDKSVIIVLNGEIYNFKEIRKDLEEKGHSFKSNSDTEVVIKAYQQYGMDCLKYFNGMFAFALYDLKKQKVFIVRDRAGVKPLYYSYTDGVVLFASELKAMHQYPGFKKEIDSTALSLYFKYGYIKAPYSIFKDTSKLLPGHFITIDLNTKEIELSQYWNVLDYYNKPTIKIDEKEALEELDKLCTSAFQYRMVSDVPVGVFLSGGYDSSLVAAVLQSNSANKLKTFTIGFNEDDFNEAEYAKKVAGYIGTDHYEYYCTIQEAQEIIPTLPHFFDEPFADNSAIPTILVSRFAKQQVTVALSADAGDEIFAGYMRYDQLTKLKRLKDRTPSFIRSGASTVLKNLPVRNVWLKKFAEVFGSSGDADLSDKLSRHFTPEDMGRLLKNAPANDIMLIEKNILPDNSDFINTLLAADYKTYMVDDILVKVDRASMSVGLEGREPLLDHRIIEWAAQLPSSLKYKDGNKKYLLKQLTHKYIPENIMNRPKMGFGIPVEEWFRGDMREYLYRYINKDTLKLHGLIEEKYAEQVRDAYLGGKKGNERRIWLLLMFQMWWEKWMG